MHLTYAFDVYTGKSSTQNYEYGLGGDVVIGLLEHCVPINAGQQILFDNYFMSYKLLVYLPTIGYDAIGTVR